MDVPSDDLFAELLTKQLGARSGGAGSTTAGAQVIARAVAADGIHPTVVDGSGLSRANRSSPFQVVRLLSRVWATPDGDVLRAALPVVGETGTVRRIARGTPAQGRCVAKTGTLDYVTNLAGYCASAGQQKLAFALFIDGPPNTRALALFDRIVADMVRLDATRP
jgi:D-alanyl-D-alanine carboxypeptidase/D-alanyl-D-alanine-endopeptidase (penicillin-binding protein 4)